MDINTFIDPELSNLIWMDIQAVPQPMRIKMYELEKKCNYITPPMSCMVCDTRVVFYLKDAETVRTQDEYKIANNIISYLTYTELPEMDAVEIFVGACPENGYTVNVLIYSVVSTTSYNNVWIGIKPETSYFKDIVNYLIDNKFQNPQLTNETYAQEPLNYDVVSLVLDKTDMMVREDEVQRALELQYKYESGMKSCIFKVVIPEKTCLLIKSYLTKPTEVGGNLVIRSYVLEKTENGDYKPVAYLGFPTNTLIVGQYENVTPPSGNFNFHTHPYHCYAKYNCTLGWPSDGDMASIPAHRDMGNIIHFVVTIEGVYSIQFTPEFGLYIDTMRKKDYINYSTCRQEFYNSIVKFFQPFNNVRTFPKDIDPQSILLQYLEKVNSVKIREVISVTPISSDCHWLIPETNFTLYSVSYMSWKDISHEGAFSVYSKNIISMDRPCLPSISEEAGKIGDELI